MDSVSKVTNSEKKNPPNQYYISLRHHLLPVRLLQTSHVIFLFFYLWSLLLPFLCHQSALPTSYLWSYHLHSKKDSVASWNSQKKSTLLYGGIWGHWLLVRSSLWINCKALFHTSQAHWIIYPSLILLVLSHLGILLILFFLSRMLLFLSSSLDNILCIILQVQLMWSQPLSLTQN